MAQKCRTMLLGMCLILLLGYVSCRMPNGKGIGISISTEPNLMEQSPPSKQAIPYRRFSLLALQSDTRGSSQFSYACPVAQIAL